MALDPATHPCGGHFVSILHKVAYGLHSVFVSMKLQIGTQMSQAIVSAFLLPYVFASPSSRQDFPVPSQITSHVSLSYGKKTLFDDASLTLEPPRPPAQPSRCRQTTGYPW